MEIKTKTFQRTITILDNLRAAIKDKREKQINHVPLRQTYLEELAEALVLNRGNIDSLNIGKLNRAKAKQVKALIQREKINHTLSNQQSNRGGLCRIDVPASLPLEPYPIGPDPTTWDGPWVSITDPVIIAKYVCAQNTRQYNQAEEIPFGSEYLGRCIGQSAATAEASAILQGTFHPNKDENLLPETLDILSSLGKPLPMGNHITTSSITPEDFISTYKIVKENTSSSPSGRHVGHYKAATTDPLLAELHSSMMSIPYMVGFSPSR